MTSKLTRERIELIANFHRAMTLPPSHAEIEELARMALAAMDGEPVRIVRYVGDGERKSIHVSLYQQLPEGVEIFAAPQPAPVVPSAIEPDYEVIKGILPTSNPDEYACCIAADMWNACRAAMLQASPVCTCPSGDGSLRWPCPVHPGNSPAQSDCCPAQNSVNPAQGGNYLVIPDEMTSEQAYEIGYYYGDPVDVFARGANWMRQHIIDSTLAAAPQSPGSEPATVPGKWIPVSERMPDDEQEVLTINKMGHRFVSFFDKHSGLFFDRLDAPAACCIEHVLVTHWMPLPAAQQEVKGE